MTAGILRNGHDDDTGTAPRAAIAPTSFAQIVHLFRSDSGPPASGENWAATIDLVQRVAQQVRVLQRDAHAMAQDAGEAVNNARAVAVAAETRAQDVRAEAEAAKQRAERAEQQVRDLTRNLATAEERIDKAERRAAELSVWLRRIHDSMTDEFNTLTITPLPLART